MKNEIKENISAMMDDESKDSARLVDYLSTHSEAKTYWRDLHLVRDTSQNVDCTLLDRNFASSIALAIDSEETYSQSADVVQIDFSDSNRKSKSWMKPLMGLAIAASVAVVSVLALRLVQTASIKPGLSPVAVNQISTNPQRRMQLKSSDFKQVNNSGTYWVVNNKRMQDATAESRLNLYLTNHLEFSSMRNVAGVLPYSRLVGYDEPEK